MNKNLWFSCMFLFLVSTGWSQDWPGWRGANRDGKVTGFQAPEKWPENLTQVWQLNVGLGDASMAMVGGKLYLSVEQEGQETALCIDAKSGKELWKTILNPSIELTGGAASHPGPRATPEVSNGKVYTLGTGGQVHCLDAETGKIIWKNIDFTEVPVFYVSMSPLLTDGMCITHLNGHDNGKVVAFNAENGDIIWTLDNQPSTYASPVLMEVDGEEFIVLQTETDLLGISKKGALLWKIPTPGEQRFYNSASPVIDGQNVIVCGQGAGTKSFKIEKSAAGYTTSENWHNPDFGGNYNTPVLKNGYLFGHEARLGKMYCINAKTGETAWNDETANQRFVATLDLGECILSLPSIGKILIVEPNSEKYNLIASYQVAEPEVCAHPLVAGNKIYVKDKEKLTCWSL